MQVKPKTRLKRQKILKAASALFSKKGFQKTTLADVGRRTGMGKASLYYYFPEGKESIFAAVVQETVSQLFSELMEKLQRIDSPADKLCTYLQLRIHHFHDQILTHGMLEDVRAELMPLAEAELRSYFDQELELLTILIKEAVKQKEFRKVNPNTTARILQAGMKGLTTDLPLQSDLKVQKAQIDELIALILHGLSNQR